MEMELKLNTGFDFTFVNFELHNFALKQIYVFVMHHQKDCGLQLSCLRTMFILLHKIAFSFTSPHFPVPSGVIPCLHAAAILIPYPEASATSLIILAALTNALFIFASLKTG